jgi:DNA processing protein
VDPALRPLLPDSVDWPRELDTIESPPQALWSRGQVGVLHRGPRVAVVGTRSPSPYGADQARRFAAHLALRGVVVVSGLARGIDSAAHAAALEVGGATVAVLGSGVDRPWPAGPLTDRVAAEGLLLSELAPGTAPAKRHFPLRNRLIAGLSRVVVVIEAAYRSGSLITARWAADQGREVLALPGRVDQPLARGCHRLLREGAGLVESPEEVLELLGIEGSAETEPSAEAEPRGTGAPRSAGTLAQRLLEALTGETASAEDLARRLERPLGEVLACLALQELDGYVARSPGGLYRRPPRSPPLRAPGKCPPRQCPPR